MAEVVPNAPHVSPEQLQSVLLAYSEHYSGPFPHPQLLAKYDQLVPGTAERIFDKFYEQQNHREQMEATIINGDNFRATLGLVLGWLLGLAFLALAGLAIAEGHVGDGSILAIVPIAAMVGTFVWGTRRRSRERSEKAAMMTEENRRHRNLSIGHDPRPPGDSEPPVPDTKDQSGK
ncbi:MAG: DUF2335 domain-containing protein [Candidatus Dormibacteria bacterium]